jgi:hypothetical protein
LQAELQKARLEKVGKAGLEKSGKVDFGSPGAYVSNMNRQQTQTTVQELKPVLSSSLCEAGKNFFTKKYLKS